MAGILLAGPGIAKLFEIVTARRIRPVHRIAEDQILCSLGLRHDQGVDRLARTGVLDAAVEFGVVDRWGHGPVVHGGIQTVGIGNYWETA
jgi:hypothetical protein